MGVLAKPVPFGDYFLLEKINTGGMAEVFKAKSFGVEGFERMLAVKRILPSIAEDKEFISMFIDEAKIAVQLTHANVAQIFDLGCIDDQYYIAMEYVPGRDARVIFDRAVKAGEKIGIDCVCYIISRICEGLDYAHNKCNANGEPLGIVHRDISPQNILISYDGECKLIDFGIAKAQSKSTATQVGILKGKFSYMSPEQIKGGKIDRRSDIFALGIVLFELLTLKRLFLGSSDFSTLEKIRKVEVSPPTLYNPNIPEELEDIVLKALEKDPAMRFQTAHEMQEALQKFMFHQNMYYGAKELSAFMHKLFSNDIDREKKKNEIYKDLTKEVLEKTREDGQTNAGGVKAVPTMIGVGANAKSSNGGKNAIYDELNNFEPKDNGIVYSDKGKSRQDDHVKKAVNAQVPLNNAPKPRKTLQMEIPQTPAAATATIAGNLERPRVSSSRLLPAIAIILTLIMAFIVGMFIYNNSMNGTGSAIFEIEPSGVIVDIEIDNETKRTAVPSPVSIDNLSTRNEHTYIISTDDYEPARGTFKVSKGLKEAHYIKLNPKSLNLEIYVTPSFATVYVDDKKLPPSEKLFKVTNVQKGDRNILVKLDDYKDFQQVINVTGNENPQKMEVNLLPAYGRLRLETEPDNKEYIITNLATNEVQRGRTNALIEKLSVDNKFSIQILDCRRNAADGDGPIEWTPNANGSLNVLNFRCENGASTGVAAVAPTTVQAPVPAQTTTVAPTTPTPAPQPTTRPSNTGSSSGSSRTTASNQPKTTTPSTPKTPPKEEPKTTPAPAPAPASGPGLLFVNSKPPANVTINGKDYGSTPLKNIELPAGTYTIRFKNDEQGIDSTQSVTIKTGETSKIMRK